MSTAHEATAVVLTALPVEYQAIRTHLVDLQEVKHPFGTIYERGIFVVEKQRWDIAIACTMAGNTTAAIEAERALAYFHPRYVLFVGVAGGLKDVHVGDIVVADRVYGYEAGKADRTFLPRPSVNLSTYPLVQRATMERMKQDWYLRLQLPRQETIPHVFVAPIAAGEKVLSSTRSAVWKFLRANYSNVLAIEMEGYGFLHAAYANHHVEALVVRGISDLVDGKSEADAAHSQELASAHASAFAFEVLAKQLVGEKQEKQTSSEVAHVPAEQKKKSESRPTERQSGKYNTHVAGNVRNLIQGDNPQVHISDRDE